MLNRIQSVVIDQRLRCDPLPAETDFFSAYDWSLDPHLTVSEAIGRLSAEIGWLGRIEDGWQSSEVATNIYLLSCSLLNGADEYLRGHTLRLPAQLARTAPGRLALRAADKVTDLLPRRDWRQVSRWKDAWQDGLDAFFARLARCETEPASLMEAAEGLSGLLQWRLPASLLGLRIGVPSAFSRLDLTHADVIALGRQFMLQHVDTSHPVLLLGLRTAGTYFSALLRSFFKAEGYRCVASLTVQPKKGASRSEWRELAGYARRGFTVAIVDDPPNSGGTISLGIDIARRAGFDLSRIKVLVPTHPAARGWVAGVPEDMVITLAPERWRKQQLLEPGHVETRLCEYFASQGFGDVRVVDSRRAVELNDELQHSANGRRGVTLKRIFEVQLRTEQGRRRDALRPGEKRRFGIPRLSGIPECAAAQRIRAAVARPARRNSLR